MGTILDGETTDIIQGACFCTNGEISCEANDRLPSSKRIIEQNNNCKCKSLDTIGCGTLQINN